MPAAGPNTSGSDHEVTEEIVPSSLPSRFGWPFLWDSLLHRGTHAAQALTVSPTPTSSVDINTSASFTEFMYKEDLAGEISEKIRALKQLDTKINQKRLLKKRTRDKLAYLHGGLGHMINIFREFVDPGFPRKQGRF